MRARTTHREPGVIGRDLDPDGPMPTEHRGPKGWEQRARQRELANTEAMGTLRQMVAHLGGIYENTKAAPRNDVLAQMTQLIPPSGVLHKGWEQLAQSFTITNLGTSPVTVTTQGIQSQAPTVGSGVAIVPGGVERTVMLRGNAVTIYGTAGQAVEFVAYARPRPPHSSLCSSSLSTVPVTQLVTVANPAVGTNFSSNPSPNAPFSVVAANFTLTTTSAPNRLAQLSLGGFIALPYFVQAAIEAVAYSFSEMPAPSAAALAAAPGAVGALPGSLVLPAGTTIASAVGGLLAGDQLSAISLLIAASPQAAAVT